MGWEDKKEGEPERMSFLDISINEKVAIVTGSSKGLGKVIAQKLADKGCKVGINYRNNAGKARAVVQGMTGSTSSENENKNPV